MEPGATCRQCESCKKGKYNVSDFIMERMLGRQSPDNSIALPRRALRRYTSLRRDAGPVLRPPC